MLRTSIPALAFLLLACGGGETNPAVDPDAGGGNTPDAGNGGNDGVLPPLVRQSGITYVGHYHGTDLRAYRTDTAEPEAGVVLELGQPTHDVVLDDVNDRLVVVSDVGRSARLFGLERPASPGAPIAAPAELSSVSFTDIPRFAAVNPYRHRVYVVTADPNQSPLTSMRLHAYDVTDPSSPVAVPNWPVTIPVTVSFALDPVRNVLFLVELTTDRVFAYDLGGDDFAELGGAPIALLEQFPQENQASFQARSLTADFRRNRLIAARSQSALSELIVITYPADIPTGGARYRDFVTLDDLEFVADGFDVDVALDERPNMLDAYVAQVDGEHGTIFLSSAAWNGTASMAVLTAFNADAGLAAGCNDVPGEGFGCFLRSYVDGSPLGYRRTDGAMCVDAENGRVVTTSVATADETEPGQVHIFDYAADLSSMAASLPAGGGNLAAGALPISAVCH